MKRVFAVIAGLALAAAYCPVARAMGDESFPFAVEVIPHENQIGNPAYYHVPGMPGERIEFKAKLSNVTDKQLEIRVVAMNAYSSKDGILYQSPEEAISKRYAMADERYGLAQYMEFYEQIILEPGGFKEASFAVMVPDIGPGTILGCIRFVVFAGTNELQQAGNEKSVQVLVDKYLAVDTAVQIDLAGEQKACIIADNAVFNSESLSLGFDIINQSAVIQNNIAGAYQILAPDGALLFSGGIDALKMAPFTKFTYSVPWQYETLEEGAYNLWLELSVDGELAGFDLPFTIGSRQLAQASAVQEEIKRNEAVKRTVIEVRKSPSSWIVLVCAAALLLGLLTFMGVQKKGPGMQSNAKI